MSTISASSTVGGSARNPIRFRAQLCSLCIVIGNALLTWPRISSALEDDEGARVAVLAQGGASGRCRGRRRGVCVRQRRELRFLSEKSSATRCYVNGKTCRFKPDTARLRGPAKVAGARLSSRRRGIARRKVACENRSRKRAECKSWISWPSVRVVQVSKAAGWGSVCGKTSARGNRLTGAKRNGGRQCGLVGELVRILQVFFELIRCRQK